MSSNLGGPSYVLAQQAEAMLAASFQTGGSADVWATSRNLSGSTIVALESRTVAQATTVPSWVSGIRTLGFKAVGDGGGAEFQRTTTPQTDAASFQSADGAWWQISSDVLNARMFGAKGNGVTGTTGNITAGTNIFSATGVTFTAADVGKVISIGGAGAAGNVFYTTISGYVSATSVTITATAVRTVTNGFFVYGSDDTIALRAVCFYANSIGKVARLPEGNFVTTGQVDPYNGLIGVHRDTSVIYYTNGIGLYGVGPVTAFRPSLTLRDFSTVGPLNGNWLTAQPNFNETSIQFAYYSRVDISNCRTSWSRAPGSKINWCGRVNVNNHETEYNARDGMYAGGNNILKVNGYLAKHIDDDCLSFHELPNNTGIVPPSSDILPGVPISTRTVEINGLIAIDTKGIRALGAVYTRIENAIITRPKEHGITIGGSSSSEGLNDPLGWDLSNISIFDPIDGATITAAGGHNNSTDNWGVCVQSSAASLGLATQPTPVNPGYATLAPTSTAVVPGKYDPTAMAWVLPEQTYLQTNTFATVPKGGAFFTRMRNVRVLVTLPNVANYSSWGFGTVLTGAGWLDPVMTAHMKSPIGMKIGSGTYMTGFDWEFEAYNVNHGIDFSAATKLERGRLKLNMTRINGDALHFGNFTGNILGGLYITGLFDLDPYYEHGNRARSGGIPTGAWVQAVGDNGFGGFGGPYVINTSVTALSGLHFTDVKLRNAYGIHNNPAALVSGQSNGMTFENITYVCNPDTSGTAGNTSPYNLGVRIFVAPASSRFVIEYCDMTQSSTFGGVYFTQNMMEATALPTVGLYVKGQVLKNSVPVVTGSAGSQYIVTGWMRLTTSKNHVLNTDWLEMRTLTGT